MDVLILSRNVAIYSTRRLTEAFRTRGRRTTVLDPCAIGVSVDGSSPPLVSNGAELPMPRVVIPRVGHAVTEHALAVVRRFETLGVPLTAGSLGIHAARDKMRALTNLAAAGIAVPPTALVRQASDVPFAVESVGGPPVVLKFLVGTHGAGVFLADSLDAARTVLEAMWELDRNLLVQRFVQSAAGRDLRLFVVDGKVVAGIRRIGARGSFRANLHHGGRAEAAEPDDALADIAVRAARVFGLAIAGVDVLESDEGPLVTEVNSSPGLEGIEDATGVDVAGAIAEAALAISGRGSRR